MATRLKKIISRLNLPYTIGLTHELETANINSIRCIFGFNKLADSLK